jgi:tRNA nucleotidyltransferase (CCA-adding enzyme)
MADNRPPAPPPPGTAVVPPDWPRRVPPAVLATCRRLRQHGCAAYVVGGSLRDLALGRPLPADWDVATAAPPQRVLELFRGAIPTGLQHGTVTVVVDGLPIEVTTFRGDGAYADGRHPVTVTFVDRIEDDLARRDFTVNALAGDPLTGELVDPFDGGVDLAARCLRAVGDPDARFAEDGLRPLRAARFAATLEFDVEPGTRAALARHLDVFRRVSRERVRDELLKLLGAPRPSVGLRLLEESGLLAEILPELARAAGFAQNRWHEFDLLEHTLRAVDAAPRGPVRLAALLHDLGKLETAAWSDDRGDRTFHGHEQRSATLAETWLRATRFPSRDVEHVTALVAHHGVYYDDDWTDAAVRRWLRRIGPAALADQLSLLHADLVAKGDRPDVPGALAAADRLAARAAALLAARPALDENAVALDGDAIMRLLGIGPGPRVGEVKRALLELVTDEPSRNTPEQLERVVRERWGTPDRGRDG